MISTKQVSSPFASITLKIKQRWDLLPCVLILVLGCANLNAQTAFPIHLIDSETKAIIKTSSIPLFDSLLIAQAAERAVINLWTKGYAEAGIDSLAKDSTQAIFYLHKGMRFKTARFMLVSNSNAIKGIPPSIRVRNFGIPAITSSTDALLNSAENQGYPFATLKLDSVTITGNKITGLLRLIPGTYVTFDTLIIKGKFRANQQYLRYLLGIKKDDVYRERLITQVNSTINRLEYLSELRPAEAEFIPNKARAYVYLRQRKANQISALIGLTGKENGGMTVKGDVNLRLLNTLNLGEKMELRWKKMETEEQKFEASAAFPWLGLGGLGTSGGITIYRRDTTILVVNPKVAITWSAPGGHQLQAFVDIRKVATSGNVSIAGYGKSNATLYGLGYSFEQIKATLYPSFEVKLATKASVGSRTADYPIDDQTTISRQSTAFGLSGKVGLYRSVAGRLGIYAGYLAGATGAFGGSGYNHLFYNELLQVGGYSTLRGFDEEFFWVSSYHVGTAEARFYFESESFASLFIDKGYLERSYIGGFQTFSPTGIGVGTQLAMGSGIFQLAYALGSNNGAAPKFKDAKVHFGFTARF